MKYTLENKGLSEMELAIAIGTTIARKNPAIIHGISIDDRSSIEINSIWLRMQSAFTPKERVWFHEVLQGNSPDWVEEDELKNLSAIETIEAVELLGTGIKIDKFLCRQTNGVLVISLPDLEKAIEFSVKRKLQYFQMRYGVANSTPAE